MGATVVIREVDERSYRNLKAEAARRNLRMGEAATQAFRNWVIARKGKRVRDVARMVQAAKEMEKIRSSISPGKQWSSVKEIRKWRRLRRI